MYEKTFAFSLTQSDELGRVVIPKEIRRTLRIREGDPLEIYTDKDGEVILKKYSPIGEISNFAKDYTESLFRSLGHIACITDKDMIVSASGTTMQEAMQKALNEVTEQIIRAVANNVTVRQTNTMSETVTGSGIESSDVYTYLSSMNSANLPFLKGITLSKAEESYWEKLRDKRTGGHRLEDVARHGLKSLLKLFTGHLL